MGITPVGSRELGLPVKLLECEKLQDLPPELQKIILEFLTSAERREPFQREPSLFDWVWNVFDRLFGAPKLLESSSALDCLRASQVCKSWKAELKKSSEEARCELRTQIERQYPSRLVKALKECGKPIETLPIISIEALEDMLIRAKSITPILEKMGNHPLVRVITKEGNHELLARVRAKQGGTPLLNSFGEEIPQPHGVIRVMAEDDGGDGRWLEKCYISDEASDRIQLIYQDPLERSTDMFGMRIHHFIFHVLEGSDRRFELAT